MERCWNGRRRGKKIPSVPFMRVAEKKWGCQRIRQLDRMEFSTDRDFRGAREKMGHRSWGERRGPLFDRPGVKGAK